MKGKRVSALVGVSSGVLFVLSIAIAWPAPAVARSGEASSASQASAPVRPIGVVTHLEAGSFTLHTDSGADLTVHLPDGVTVLSVPPGAKDLKTATKISASEISGGDRVFVHGKFSEDQKSIRATTVIVMSRAEIASVRQKEQLEWRRGVGGIVKGVDPATKSITISVPNTPPTPENPTRPLTIALAPNAALLRYAPNSVKFSDAKPGTFGDIRVGDQIRALGSKSEDGSRFTAEKIVSGTFRNLAATVISVDASAGAVTVKDLATQKPVVVRTNAESQLHRLPPFVAQRIAMMNAGGAPGGGAPGGGAAGGGPEGKGFRQGQGGGRASGGPAGESAGGPGGSGGFHDFQQMLERMPPLSLSELKPGDALIAVSTEGANPSELTAIVLLAGVEPILMARPKGSKQVVLPAWTMGMSGGEGEGGP